MNSSQSDARRPEAVNVTITDDTLTVDLVDGRTLSVPLVWYPRLAHATTAERQHWTVIGRGEGIHWRELDEDISVAGLLAGRGSSESQSSLQKWLRGRQQAG
ncbi:MAG TPA: DUF2442 domain-containing protein [Polyangiaceae bacterium]|jgi:hypothetical protein|nr:DUF2442 domain-containing protein [Polyangiaceae bacterium]